MGQLDNGYLDADMVEDFVSWLVQYLPSDVFSIDDERGIELARRNPRLAWVESTYEQAFLIPLGGLDGLEFEQSMKGGSRWVNSRIYICQIPFKNPKSTIEDWVLVGAHFGCENCDPGPGEDGQGDCTACSGDGWMWLTVYDYEAREELEEACEENGVTLPSGFLEIKTD